MGLEQVMAHLYRPDSSMHFSVPDPATGHLIKFGDTPVSLKNASPTQIVLLLCLILLQCNKANRLQTYASVCHLLSRGVDVNLIQNDSQMMPPLSMAVGADFIDVRIVAALLKAGANPWLTFNRPDHLALNSQSFSIADFYGQLGMDINAESTAVGLGSGKLSALGMAYVAVQARGVYQLLEAGAYVGDAIALSRGNTEQSVCKEFGPATLDAIASYRAQRAFQPGSFIPYTLLHDTLEPGRPAAGDIGDTRLTTTASIALNVPASGSALAQAALKPACNALVDGLYTATQVARLLGCVNNMPPGFAQAVVPALALARVLGHYGSGQGARAAQLDQGIRVALAGAVLWESYLGCKARFDILQTNIDRHQADGRTLLTMAASEGKIRMIRLLVKLGARVNYPDAHGDYPLTAAAKARRPDTCSALLSLGANAGTSDLQKRSTLFHVTDWLTQTDISDTATVGRIASLIEQLLSLGYDFRQPTPDDYTDHADYPTVADLLCKPENCVKLAMLGPQRTETLSQAILFNIDRRGSQPFLTDGH